MTTQNLSWQELFTAAMLELDPTRLEQKIKTANVAIQERLRELQAGRTDEARQLTDAVLSLRSIEKTDSGTRPSLACNANRPSKDPRYETDVSQAHSKTANTAADAVETPSESQNHH